MLHHPTVCVSVHDMTNVNRPRTSLHCTLSCAVYCNRPCLCVCLFVDPPYYSHRAAFTSPLSTFSLKLFPLVRLNINLMWQTLMVDGAKIQNFGLDWVGLKKLTHAKLCICGEQGPQVCKSCTGRVLLSWLVVTSC